MTKEQLLDFCNKKFPTCGKRRIASYVAYDNDENIKARFYHLKFAIAENRDATIVLTLNDVTHDVVVNCILISVGIQTFCIDNDITAAVQTDEEICKFIADTIDTYRKSKIVCHLDLNAIEQENSANLVYNC